MTWLVDEEVQPDRTIHVYPEDGYHNIDPWPDFCWCIPLPEEQENGVVVVVHSERDWLA